MLDPGALAPIADDSTEVALLVVLLLGSITAGILFASPLRRRYMRESPDGEAAPADTSQGVPLPRMPGGDILSGGVAPAPGRLVRSVALAPSIWSTGPPLEDERYLPARRSLRR